MARPQALLPFAALIALLALATAPALGAGPLALFVDFSEDTPNEPPASAASVASGPDRPAFVVADATDPPDPFLRPGNRSLMLENSTAGTAPSILFEAERGLARGSFAIEFFLEISYGEREGRPSFHQSELQVSLNDGGDSGISFRIARRMDVAEGGQSVRLGNSPYHNRANYLLVHFDAEEGTFSGTLNGKPLARGDRTDFAFEQAVEKIDRISIRPGRTAITAGRAFVDRIALAEPGEIDEAGLLARMPTHNVLPNPSFEEADTAREVYPITGEYRKPVRGHWEIDDAEAWHGGRSLKMAGTHPYFWQVMEQVSEEWVFSVYLKAAEPGQQVEIGLEKHEYGNEGNIWARGRTRRRVSLGDEWERFVLVGRQDDEERGGEFASGGSNQYRAWVRPLDGGPVWVDAAQLELDRSEPSPFDPARRGSPLELNKLRMMGQNIIDLYGPKAELQRSKGAVSGEGSVPLAVRETAGADRSPAPAWGGVPFPAGELYDERQARLTDNQGQAVPVQTKVLARWPSDASVRALLVDFQADVPAGGTARYTLHYGGDPTEPGPPLATDDGERIEVDTGKAVFSVRRDSFRWFEAAGLADPGDAPPGSYVVGLDSTLYSSAWGEPEEIVIENNGPRRAVVMVRGKHHTEDGERAMLDYEARIHAFADSAVLYLEHTFENREPAMNLAVQSHYLRLPVAESGVSQARFGLRGGGTLEAAVAPGRPATLTQVKDYYGEGRYVVLKDQGADNPARTFGDAQASGAMEAGAAALAVEDFWLLHPKAISAEPNAVQVCHWPERHVRFVDLPWGVSNTMRLAYAPFGASAKGAGAGGAALSEEGGATVGAEPLLLQPDVRWTAESGVFGHYMTAADAWEKFPGFEFAVDRHMNNLAIDREVAGLTGMWDYGDVGTPHSWRNNEHTVARNLWLQYLRTGDPAIGRRAWTLTRHFRDVDVAYGGPGSRAVSIHYAGYHTSRNYHLGHYWITGIVWHYLLTGDMRSYRVAVESGANVFVRWMRDRRGRERARQLYHLAELYELSQLEVFRDRFERTYEYVREGTRGGAISTAPYHGGKELQAVARWYSITGDERFRNDWLAGAEALLANHRGPAARPRIRSGRDTRLFDALAAVALHTGEARFVADVYDLFVHHLVSMDFSDNVVRAGSEFLRAADRLGVPTPEAMPDWTLGLPPMTGFTVPEPLRFRVASEPGQQDEPIVLKIYYSPCRVRVGEHDAVIYHVADPEGNVVAEGVVEGGASGRADIVRLPPTAEGEEYSVELAIRARAIGELSSSSRRVFLETDSTFAVRWIRGQHGLLDYHFRVPKDRSEIGFTFRLRRNRGDAVAVMIRCPEGQPIASRLWVVPAGTVFNAEGERLEDGGLGGAIALTDSAMQRGTPITGGSPGWRMEIPERYRGETLSFVMFPQKWMRWRVHGLEDWRLGPTRESFAPADD